MVILVDAMGGENAPEAMIDGSIDAIKQSEGFEICLLGDSAKIEEYIVKKREFNSSRISIVHADEVISNEAIPTKAIKESKKSSMVMGLEMLKKKKGDIFVSAGSTGALMVGALFILGRIKKLDRPALLAPIPAQGGSVSLIDCGANANCKVINYEQFAMMGSIYAEYVLDIKNPKVGLINIGSENIKGNELVKQAFIALENSNINFIGNVEGNQLLKGFVDVAVCDGFIGNILLKTLEGVGSFIGDGLKNIYNGNFISKLSALVVKRKLIDFKKSMDATEYGGVPLLGVKGIVVKCHGYSDSKAIKNAIINAKKFCQNDVLEKLELCLCNN